MSESPGVIIDDGAAPAFGRKVGYAIAIVFGGVLLFIVNNVLAWGWFPWLTDDFERVLPILNLSIIASMIVHAIFLAYDPKWFKTIADILTTSLSIAVFVAMWQVFPFDFAAYGWNWERTVRWLIGLVLFATTIALIVNLVLLARIAMGLATADDR